MEKPFYNIRSRYQNDPSFSRLVDMMRACIENAQFTPTEIREAAMLAQIMYEETHVRPSIFTCDDVSRGKV
jgi:hypothetical protein